MKVVFLGTPVIGTYALKSLIDNDQIEVVAVVTLEDKPIGRSHSNFQPTPVAQMAVEHNIPVIKTASINKDIDKLKEYEFDYLLTCAFGQFLSNAVLETPKKYALNIHASLLPEGRGGAPIHGAIIHGKKETGFSLMEMVAAMDAGQYFSQYKIDIASEDTYDSLYDKLCTLIYNETANSLIEVENGKQGTQQNESLATFWLNVRKEDSKVNFDNEVEVVYNQIRGLNSKPGAWSKINNTTIKIYESNIHDYDSAEYEPGTIIDINEEGILVQTKKGIINIDTVTLEGGKKNHIKNLMNGNLKFQPKDKFN